MSDNHPITPPPELVQQWRAEIWHEGTPVRMAASDLHIATQAARWGSDHELLACGNYLEQCAAWEEEDVIEFYNYRRPKPPSLKEQALKILEEEPEADDVKELVVFDVDQVEIIRKALEQLND